MVKDQEECYIFCHFVIIDLQTKYFMLQYALHQYIYSETTSDLRVIIMLFCMNECLSN